MFNKNSALSFVCIVFFLCVTLTILQGVTLVLLWKWFIVSTFGVKQITVSVAIGIMVMLNFILPRERHFNENTSVEEVFSLFTDRFIQVFSANICGYILAQFV